jgi:hypothetical protein
MCLNILYPQLLKTKIPLNTCKIHYCVGDKIEKNEIGGACSSDERGERHVQGFGGET